MEDLTRQQVRAMDRCAIERVGVEGLVLMENAGRGAADAIESHLGNLTGRSVAIVAGGGNNGGDGLVIARHLAMRGAKVTSFLIADPHKLTHDSAVNLKILRALGHDVRRIAADQVPRLAGQLKACDLVVDAVGGTGIQGALRGEAAEAVEQINAAGRPVVAVDIPTGLDCDTGEAPGPTVRAEMTVTFLAPKKGFGNPAAKQYLGQLVVADIGVPPNVVREMVEKGEDSSKPYKSSMPKLPKRD